MSDKQWYCYYFIVDGVIKFKGITADLKRRASEHMARNPKGKIKQIGKRCTLKEAKQWELNET